MSFIIITIKLYLSTTYQHRKKWHHFLSKLGKSFVTKYVSSCAKIYSYPIKITEPYVRCSNKDVFPKFLCSWDLE